MDALTHSPRRASTLTLLGLAALIAGGCGRSTDGRVAVDGAVTLDGRPLDDGFVTLRPLDKGPAVTGSIRGGKFELAASEGPAAGPYVVEIDAIKPTGRQVPNPDFPNEKIEETVNVVPKQYNRASTLRIELVADRDNHFEIPVRTR